MKTPKAEKERFELSNGFTRYTISSRAPSTKLGDFSLAACSKPNGNIVALNETFVKKKVFFVLFFNHRVTP